MKKFGFVVKMLRRDLLKAAKEWLSIRMKLNIPYMLYTPFVLLKPLISRQGKGAILAEKRR
ncbi:MAG: hypothetical protein N3D19_01645 [Archaeoglobaceae archaeon]|nr:hypothetical protein [Archaeoglobaceae archaeon]